MSKTLEELRQSSFSQRAWAKNACRIRGSAARSHFRNGAQEDSNDVGDVWLIVADFAKRAVAKVIESQFLSQDSTKS
jgi:hypothetical protein